MMGWIAASGAVVGLGSVLIVAGARPATARLDDALGTLAHRAPLSSTATEGKSSWSPATWRLPLTQKQQRLLLMQGRAVGDFFTEKLIFAAAGLLLPGVWMLTMLLLGQQPSPTPLFWGLAVLAAAFTNFRN